MLCEHTYWMPSLLKCPPRALGNRGLAGALGDSRSNVAVSLRSLVCSVPCVPFLASDVRADTEHDVLMTKSSELGNSEPGLHGEQGAASSRVRPGQLLRFGAASNSSISTRVRKPTSFSCVALAGHCQHALDDGGLGLALAGQRIGRTSGRLRGGHSGYGHCCPAFSRDDRGMRRPEGRPDPQASRVTTAPCRVVFGRSRAAAGRYRGKLLRRWCVGSPAAVGPGRSVKKLWSRRGTLAAALIADVPSSAAPVA